MTILYKKCVGELEHLADSKLLIVCVLYNAIFLKFTRHLDSNLAENCLICLQSLLPLNCLQFLV